MKRKIKKVMISVLVVAAVLAVGGLIYLFAKGYPVGISTREVSDFPIGMKAELSDVTGKGGVLTLVLTDEQAQQGRQVYLNEAWEVLVERKGKDGNWISLAESKVPLPRFRIGRKPIDLCQEVNVIQVDWESQYGTLSAGDYRLLFRLYPKAAGDGLLVAVPFTVAS